MIFARRPYENGMPNAVAGNLQCLAVQWCMLGRKEVDRGHGVKCILLAHRTENCIKQYPWTETATGGDRENTTNNK